jgi:hypothetical protein
MRSILLAFTVLAALAARAAASGNGPAAERPLNPDRWTTFELDASGLSPWKSDQIVYNPGSPDADNKRKSLDTTASVFALMPLTDSFSLILGFGGDWSEVETANAGASGSSFNDSSLVTYRASGRWYFEDEGSTRWNATQNPDRWPSLGVNGSGNQLIHHSAGNASTNSFSDSASNSQTLTFDTRLPVSDSWTLTAAAGGSRSDSESKTSVTANPTVNLSGSVTASAGARYYFVGKNFILNDEGVNPDMWSMVYLTASGSRSVYDKQALPAGNRDTTSMSESATVGARLPITDHASLNFSTQMEYSRSYTPPFSAANGTLTRTASLTFTAGLRYFLF